MSLTAIPATVRHSGQPALPHVTVLSDRCAGCQECSVRCPTGALVLDPLTWTVTADDPSCVGCRQCVRTCPFSAITVAGPVLVAPRTETASLHPEVLRSDSTETRRGLLSWTDALSEAARCLECPDPTCVRGCPAHNDIPAFIAAIGRGDLDGAHDVLRRTSILPDVCARVCDQAVQCEGACSWALAGESPVAIGALERFVTDNASVPPLAVRDDARGTGLDVAVIGSGPAGAAAAWELVEAGARVTVLERDDAPGGLLRWGIPDFTLPDVVARRVWTALSDSGVELRLGTDVPAGGIDALLADHDAVVVAAGAGTPLRLAVPGADLDGVWDATAFLTAAHEVLGHGGGLGDLFPDLRPSDPDRMPRVLVLGAGNTAMDTARTARRLGADAMCIDWMHRAFAPVRPDELVEAEEEGVEVGFLRTLARLEGDERGRVRRAWLSHTRQDRADRPPEVVEREADDLEVDMVVMAMGYRVDPGLVEALGGLPVRKHAPPVPDRHWAASGITSEAASRVAWARGQAIGRLALAREGARTAAALPRRPRVWTAGDALTGPSTVVEAMAQGKQAAEAIVEHRPSAPTGGDGSHRAPSGGARGRTPDRGLPTGGPGRALVAYDSRTGTTQRAAEAVAAQLHQHGIEVRPCPIAHVSMAGLAWADLIVLGTWVDGLIVAGVRPARPALAWLANLPWLGGMPAAVFCTYGFAPRGAVAIAATALRSRGAEVLVEGAVSRRRVEEDAARFASALLAAAGVTAEAGGEVTP